LCGCIKIGKITCNIHLYIKLLINKKLHIIFQMLRWNRTSTHLKKFLFLLWQADILTGGMNCIAAFLLLDMSRQFLILNSLNSTLGLVLASLSPRRINFICINLNLTFLGSFVPSLVPFGWVVLHKKLTMWKKVYNNGWQMQRDA
jgi:hypothetical protein